jgi:iron complex outermembrane recepter protein
MTSHKCQPGRYLRSLASVLSLLAALGAALPESLAQAPGASRKAFNVTAGDAATEIKEFAKQAAVDVMFPTGQMRGVTTCAVKGEFTPGEALGLMLAGTSFAVIEDPESGALAVKRAKGAGGSLERRQRFIPTPGRRR